MKKGTLYWFRGNWAEQEKTREKIADFVDNNDLVVKQTKWYKENNHGNKILYERYIQMSDTLLIVDFGSWTTFLVIEYEQ